MKKFLSIVLALTMVLSLSATAFAGDKGSKGGKEDKQPKQEATTRPGQAEDAITADEAEAAALADAGLSKAEVSSLHTYKNYVRGIVVSYTVEFAVRARAERTTTVYSYTIDLAGAVAGSSVYAH